MRGPAAMSSASSNSAATDRHVVLALFAEPDRSRRPVQQLGADPLLKEGDGAADGRRGAADLAPRRREASLVHRKDEHVHCIRLPPW